jgi:hypothetical protein
VDINILGKLITLLFKAFDGLHGITQDYSCYDEREWRAIRDQDNDYQKVSIYYDNIYDILKFKSNMYSPIGCTRTIHIGFKTTCSENI